MSRIERLDVLDELFLHLEGPTTHMHVGGLAVFEGSPPEPDELSEAIAARLHLVPRFRQRLATIPYGLGRPVWVDDSHFNLGYHVRHTALPAPGDESELRELVARIMSQQLDRTKPLWEIWLVHGLSRNRFAIISKTHHALVDGVSGADLMTVLLDFGPEPPPQAPEPWDPAPVPSDDELLGDAIRQWLTSPAEIIRTAQSALMDPANISNRLARSMRALGEFLGNSFSAPESSLNRPIGPHRRFETVLAALDDFKKIKNTMGGTVNDAVLAVTSGALRTLLHARGESLNNVELRAMVPISTRSEDERGALGNRVAALWVGLPIHEPDPVIRLKLVQSRMRELKQSEQAMGAQLLTSLGNYAPPTILARAARLIARQRAFNLVVTNVPGPQAPLYALGREMKEIYPLVPLANNTTVAIALFSYNGTIGFGLVGDLKLASDLGVLAEGIEKSIIELLGAVE